MDVKSNLFLFLNLNSVCHLGMSAGQCKTLDRQGHCSSFYWHGPLMQAAPYIIEWVFGCHDGCVRMQVLIRWALERGCSVLPKSTNPDRIAANLAVSTWRIDAADVQTLSNMPYQVRGAAAAAAALGHDCIANTLLCVMFCKGQELSMLSSQSCGVCTAVPSTLQMSCTETW
jgi:hypothetical protein